MIQLNRSKQTLSQFYRIIIPECTKLPKDRKPKADFSINKAKWVKESFAGNFYGYLITLAAFRSTNPMDTIDLDQVKNDLTYLLVGLKLYEVKHGTLPEHLAQLSPDIIPVLPFDHYSQKFYQYDREKRRIWSIGDDFENAGGLDKSKKTKKAPCPRTNSPSPVTEVL